MDMLTDQHNMVSVIICTVTLHKVIFCIRNDNILYYLIHIEHIRGSDLYSMDYGDSYT